MQSFTFDTFDKGEYGSKGGFQAGLEPGWWSGKNLCVYRDGSIGPRWGVKELTTTGLVNGVSLGLWFNPVTGAELGIVIADKAYAVNNATGVATVCATSFTVTPTEPVDTYLTDGAIRHIANPNEGLYYMTHVAGAPTLTRLTLGGDPPGRAVALHGDRLFYGGPDSFGHRVWYSDAAALSTWGAGSFFDVGYLPQIRFLHSQRNALLIAKQDGSWWLYTGVPGAATLRAVRRAGRNPWHLFQPMCVALGNEDIVFIDNGQDWPTIFNGATFQELDALGFMGGNAPGNAKEVGGARLLRSADMLLVSGKTTPAGAVGRMIQRLYGVWSFHTFGVTVTAQVAQSDTPLVYLTDGGAGGAHPKIWQYNTGQDRPAFVSDTYGLPGDNTTVPFDAFLHLPEKWAPDGQLYGVRSVQVDFKSWDTGITDPLYYNHFGVQVRALERSGRQAPVQTSGVQTFDEVPSASSTAGSYRRMVFNVGDQGYAGGFEVYLTAIRGVSIVAVTVLADTRTQRAG